MSVEKPTALPEHLAELLRPTPSGVAKLLAAWDGLHCETQIALLTEITKSKHLPHSREQIRSKALDSSNAYVRYLAAVMPFHGLEDPESQTIGARIEADPSKLVRYALFESEFSILDPLLSNPQTFFALPHEARLAKVRRLRGHGQQMAELVRYAVANNLKDGKVSEIELSELLADYLDKPGFRDWYAPGRDARDPMGSFYLGKDLESLWHLVPIVPEAISVTLLELLPESAGMSTGIPDDVLAALTNGQREMLLWRPDIDTTGFRKSIFKNWETEPEGVRVAAASTHFDLTNDEFASLYRLPEKSRLKLLTDLAGFARELRLCVYEAIGDTLKSQDADGSDEAEAALKKRLSQLSGDRREREILELRLYRLAVHASVHPSQFVASPDDKLHFLRKCLVPGNTCFEIWETFCELVNEWARHGNNELVRYLPRLHGVDSDESFYRLNGDEEIPKPATKDDVLHVAEGIQMVSGAIQQLETRLDDVKGSVQGLREDHERLLSDGLTEVGRHIAMVRNTVTETGEWHWTWTVWTVRLQAVSLLLLMIALVVASLWALS